MRCVFVCASVLFESGLLLDDRATRRMGGSMVGMMSALPYAKLRVLEGRSESESAQLADWRGVASVLSALQGRQRVQHEIAEAIDASVDVPLLVYPEGAVNPVSTLNAYRVRTNAHGPLHLPFV